MTVRRSGRQEELSFVGGRHALFAWLSGSSPSGSNEQELLRECSEVIGG